MDIVQLSANRFVNLAMICDVEFGKDDAGETAATVSFSGAYAVYVGMEAENLRECLEDAADRGSCDDFEGTATVEEFDPADLWRDEGGEAGTA